MVPYPTVLRQIDMLSDAKYDTVPEQPPPSVPTKQAQRTKAELKQKPTAAPSSSGATGGVAPSKSTSGSSLHEVPPLMTHWKSRTSGVKCYFLRAGKPTIG